MQYAVYYGYGLQEHLWWGHFSLEERLNLSAPLQKLVVDGD